MTVATTDQGKVEEIPVHTEAEKAAAAEDAEATAQFEEGFKEAEEPTIAPASTESPTPAGAAPAPAAAPVPEYVQVTKEERDRWVSAAAAIDEIKATVEKQFGTAFGKMGGLERTLKQLQDATPAGQTVTVSEEDFEELRADFPELAAMTVKGLNRALTKVKGTAKPAAPAAPATPAFDHAKVDEIVNQRLTEQVAAVRQETSRNLLAVLHEDWEEIVGPKDSKTAYRGWLAKQPTDYQAEITNSWDAMTVSKSIDKFQKETQAAAPPATPTTTDPRKERWRGAIPLKGAGGPTPAGKSDDDEFTEGFRTG